MKGVARTPEQLQQLLESLIRKHQQKYYAALAAADRAGKSDPFLEHMLQILLLALTRLAKDLRGQAETAEGHLAKARQALDTSWFARRAYMAIYPRLSTASASRDLARGLASRALVSRGKRRNTEYRFR